MELTIKRNDLQPYVYAQAIDSTGTAIDLTGASIVATMRNIDSGTLKINRQSAGVNITTASTGMFQYEWQAGDSNTTGTYSMEFEITPVAGGKFTLPTKTDLIIIVVADEDTV